MFNAKMKSILFVNLVLAIFFGVSVSDANQSNQVEESTLIGESDQDKIFKNEKTYFEYENVRCTDSLSDNCYQEVRCKILLTNQLTPEKLKECLNKKEDSSGGALEVSINEYSKIRLTSHSKAQYTILTIHGLWRALEQFKGTVDQILASNSNEINALELVLPGHIKENETPAYSDYIKRNKPYASYHEWLVALENSLKIAKAIGNKVIIIGHSNGGLLATIAALKYPDMVDQLVLLEPALRLRKIVGFGSCFSRYLSDETIAGFAKIIGRQVPEWVSVPMGCEVQKLADQFIPRRTKHQEYDYISSYQQPIEDYGVYEDLAKKIKVPVLMMNNEKDNVVSAKANIIFYKALETKKEYYPLNKNGKIQHGYVTIKINDSISFQLFEFNYKADLEDIFGNYYLTKLKNLIAHHGSEIDILNDSNCIVKVPSRACDNQFKYLKTRSVFLINSVCEYLNNNSDCQRLTQVILEINQFWKSVDKYFKKNGAEKTQEWIAKKSIAMDLEYMGYRFNRSYLREFSETVKLDAK